MRINEVIYESNQNPQNIVEPFDTHRAPYPVDNRGTIYGSQAKARTNDISKQLISLVFKGGRIPKEMYYCISHGCFIARAADGILKDLAHNQPHDPAIRGTLPENQHKIRGPYSVDEYLELMNDPRTTEILNKINRVYERLTEQVRINESMDEQVTPRVITVQESRPWLPNLTGKIAPTKKRRVNENWHDSLGDQ